MTASSFQIELPAERDTAAFAARLAPLLSPLSLITLQGDLGAGKTTLARGVLRGLGHYGKVRSPTYTLVESYPECVPPVHHFDLYRLADPEELEFLGFSDYLAQPALLMVEWPEKGEGWLPQPDLALTLEYAGQGRRLTVAPMSEQGALAASRLLTSLPTNDTLKENAEDSCRRDAGAPR